MTWYPIHSPVEVVGLKVEIRPAPIEVRIALAMDQGR